MNKSQEKYLSGFEEPIAFVLGIYPTSNLGAVRNLGRCLVPTVVLDVKRNQAAFYSKYAKGMVCPHPKFEEESYIDFLMSLGVKLHKKGVLIPTGDTELLTLLRHRSQLEKCYYFTMSSFEKVNLFLNKELFYRYLEQHNFPHAKTFFPQNEDEVEAISKELSYPLILKPVYPTYFRLDFHTKLFVISSRQELLSCFRMVSAKKHEVMIQEIIPGDADRMFGFNAYYDQTGASHGMFMYQRIREWPLGFGNGCVIQQVHVPLLEQLTTSLIRMIGYYGIVDAEFKYDSRDEQYKFIEINPRVWMQNSFPSRFGCNLPYLAYLDAVHKPLPEESFSPQIHPIKWVYFLEDLQSLRALAQKGSFHLQSLFSDYSLRNEYALFSWDDPVPFFILGCQSLSTVFSNLFRSNH